MQGIVNKEMNKEMNKSNNKNKNKLARKLPKSVHLRPLSSKVGRVRSTSGPNRPKMLATSAK